LREGGINILSQMKEELSMNMTNEELRKHNEKRRIHQICVVTNDVHKVMKNWVENMNVGPWRLTEFSDETVKGLRVNGELVTEPFKFLIAISYIGDLEIEIIQPVYGPMIYQKFLDEKGEGLHHIKEKVADEDLQQVLAEYKSHGIEVTQTGQFQTDFHYYLNTDLKLDVILELGNCPAIELPPERYTIYPPEK
jgi:methylmalonyl-CoA/ethylmalonyl-CoA epimerase